jgi:hypothetical protein
MSAVGFFRGVSMSDGVESGTNDLVQALLSDVGSRAERSSWARFVAALAHMGLGQDGVSSSLAGLSPALFGQWLLDARPSAQVRAQRLLMLMSRHRWLIEEAPPTSPNRQSQERLRVLLSVQGHAWVLRLAAVPRVHVLSIEPVPVVRA